MNATVERGIAAWLRANLPGADVREATSAEDLPGDSQYVVAQCAETEHVVGNLHKATVRVIVSTPARGSTAAEHAATCRQVAELLAGAPGLAEAFFAETGWRARGHFMRQQSETRDGASWVSTAEAVLGVES